MSLKRPEMLEPKRLAVSCGMSQRWLLIWYECGMAATTVFSKTIDFGWSPCDTRYQQIVVLVWWRHIVMWHAPFSDVTTSPGARSHHWGAVATLRTSPRSNLLLAQEARHRTNWKNFCSGAVDTCGAKGFLQLLENTFLALGSEWQLCTC